MSVLIPLALCTAVNLAAIMAVRQYAGPFVFRKLARDPLTWLGFFIFSSGVFVLAHNIVRVVTERL